MCRQPVLLPVVIVNSGASQNHINHLTCRPGVVLPIEAGDQADALQVADTIIHSAGLRNERLLSMSEE